MNGAQEQAARCAPRSRAWITRALFAFALLLNIALPSRAQVVARPKWCVNGSVLATARTEDHYYVGGFLRDVGRPSGGGLPVSAATGSPDLGFPQVAGVVNAATSDGHGGWFIGGDFVAVAGQPRGHLAHILESGEVAAWAPEADGVVWSLFLAKNMLLVGGDFTSIDAIPRGHLAAFNATNGQLLGWGPSLDGRVGVMRADSERLFVGGIFATAGGQARRNLVSIDLQRGVVLPWNPGTDRPVVAMELRDTTVYVGGLFWSVGGIPRRYVAAIDRKSGATLAWDAHIRWTSKQSYEVGWGVTALSLVGERLYVCGEFDSLGGCARDGLGALDPHTAECTEWDPECRGWSYQNARLAGLTVSNGAVFVCGDLTSLGGRPCEYPANPYAGAVDITTGTRTLWNPRPNSSPSLLAASGGRVFLGGDFTSTWNWQARTGLVAFNTKTGEVDPWDPDVNGTVWTILPRGGVVYVGGEFTRFCGQSRNFAAAFNEASGLPTPWNPSADAQVEVIVPSMTALFLGGAFKEIGGSARPMLAEVDTISGATTSWSTDTGDPNEVFRPEVTALAVRDSVLFASGAFAHLGGQPRAGVAALELRSGRATPWVANTDGFVLSFAVAESTVFLGGSFSVVNGVPRSNLAAVSVATGAPLAWRADAGDPLHAHGPVYALALTDSTLYVGGAGPTSFDGSSTSSVAAIDIRTGATRDWAVPMDYSFISTMSVVGRELDVGGYFRRAGVWRAAGVATISCWSDPGSSRSAAALELAQSWPNPARDAATIAFQLSADAYATLELFDLQGRCVRRVLRAQRLEAGNHTVQVPTGALKTGCYFYRLTVGDLRAARRLVVVH